MKNILYFWLMPMMMISMLSGCGWFDNDPYVMTELEIIRPDIPKLNKLPQPEYVRVPFKKHVMDDGKVVYYTSKEGIYDVKNNMSRLKMTIRAYEDIIKEYDEFREDYNSPPTPVEPKD